MRQTNINRDVNVVGASDSDSTLELTQNKAMLVLLVLAVISMVHSAPVTNISLPLDCEDVYNLITSTDNSVTVSSGVYTIYPEGPNEPVDVYCDMGCEENNSHQNDKWTVIQRRIDGNVSFYRPWEQYKEGFGDADGEYWIGLRNIFLMTYREKYQLKVEIEDFENGNAYAQYTLFYVEPESSKYRLNIGGYINGGAGDSLSYVNGREFSTFDQDPTGYCAETFSGGFWYSYYYWGQCHLANPNGLYKRGNVVTANTGIMWQTWKGNYYSLKSIVMKIRRLGLEDIADL